MEGDGGDAAATLPSHRLLCTLFFFSGLTSLVFQMVWLRGFAVVLGGTLYSFACVVTAFMLGLTLGSLVAGRLLRDRLGLFRGRFLLAYGILELLIGLYALGFTPTLFFGQEHYLRLVAAWSSDVTALKLILHFALSLGLLLVPTFCMGATLPILCMAVEEDTDVPGLYAFNTFGAAAGCLVASFVLIYLFGVLTTTFVAVALNALIFGVALVVQRRVGPSPTAPSEAEAASPAAPDGWSPGALLGLAFFSGYTFFSLELVWNRCLSLILGNRVYVTSVTLALVLFCLGVGARLCRLSLLSGRSPRRILITGYLVAAVAMTVGLFLEPVALRGSTQPGVVLLFVTLMILVPGIAMGAVFPLLLSLPVEGSSRGSHVGRIYGANTLGSVLGTLLTGYVLISLLGSNRILIINALLVLGCALLVAVGGVGIVEAIGRRKWAAAIGIACALCTLSQWSQPLSSVDPSAARVLEEDSYGVFSISPVNSAGHLSVRCNSTELVFHYGSPVTQYVQESQAHVPLIFAPSWGRILVLGSGYGITAGTFGSYEGVGVVDAVEILPLMVEHADLFDRWSHSYHENPKVRVHVEDGRHFLAVADEPYDVISINVSDPYLPGSSSLFSQEFYALVEQRLAPRGVVCQHMFGPDTASLLHGFHQRFPHMRAIPGYDNSLSVVGSKHPLTDEDLARILADAGGRPLLNAIGLSDRGKLEQALAAGDAMIAELLAKPAAFVNSDLRPTLEFRRRPGLSLFRSNF